MPKPAPKKIGVLAHPMRPSTNPLAASIIESLDSRGLEAWLHTGEDFSQADQTHLTGIDMVVAIGGDGAMLHAARVCAPFDIPVLGINIGRLGFLTEISSPQRWPEALDSLLAGDFWVEKRMMLDYQAYRGEELLSQGSALNDVVIGRGSVASSVWLETYIDTHWATTYVADNLIIATPTGSTAYAMAAGGPILPPELKNILVVPVAPHLSMDRPIVVSEGARIEVYIAPQTRTDAVATVDGVLATSLTIDDHVVVQASNYTSRFIRLRGPAYFYRSLLDRLEPRHPARTVPQRNSRTPDARSPDRDVPGT